MDFCSRIASVDAIVVRRDVGVGGGVVLDRLGGRGFACSDGLDRRRRLLRPLAEGDVEQCPDDIGGDVGIHLLEHVEAFVGIGLERISLGVGTKPDRIAELGHLVDVLGPTSVDAVQGDRLFGEVAHVLVPVLAVLGIDFLELGGEQIEAVGIGDFVEGFLRDPIGIDGEQFGGVFGEFLSVDELFLILEEERGIRDGFGDEVEVGRDCFGDGLRIEDLVSPGVHDLSLTGENIIVVEQLLTGVEVLSFDTLLGLGDGAGHHAGLEGIVAELLVEALVGGGSEADEDFVFHGDVELGIAGIALTSGTAFELVVNTAGFVSFRRQDRKTAQILDAFSQLDVGTSTSHVRGDGDGAFLTGLGDDEGFPGVVLGIEDFVFDADFVEHFVDDFGFFDGRRADQNRLSLFMSFLDVLDQSVVLGFRVAEDGIDIVLSLDGTVGGDTDDSHVVDFAEFLFLGLGGTGHAGQLVIETEEVLVSDCGKCHRFWLDGDMFLRLNGLLETVGIFSSFHDTAGETVDQQDFVVLDHVFGIPLHDVVGLEGLLDSVSEVCPLGIEEVVDGEGFLDELDTMIGQGAGLLFDVDGIISVFSQSLDGSVCRDIRGGRDAGTAGNDKRSTGFVDEDGVGLVDDGVMETPEDAILDRLGHVVSQIVEAELGVGGVGDVAFEGILFFFGVLFPEVDADGQTEEAVDVAHPLCVSFGEIFVDGDDMDAFSFQGVEINGHGGSQGFSFAGFHLGDVALVEDGGTEDLDRIGELMEDSLGGFPCGGESLRKDVVDRLSVLKSLFENRSEGLQLVVGHLAEAILILEDPLRFLFDFLESASVNPEQFVEKTHAVLLSVWTDKIGTTAILST